MNTQELIDVIVRAQAGTANFSTAALGTCILSNVNLIVDALQEYSQRHENEVQIATQNIGQALETANDIATIGGLAIERAEEYLEDNPNATLETLRDNAVREACQLFDGDDSKVLSDFEFKVLGAEYVYAVLHWYVTHINPSKIDH